MLVNCKSCQKKFLVPEAAITESGRLLQCGSCGNKWTQYPIKQILEKEIKKITPNITKNPTRQNKVKISAKKRKVNLYSEEYLKKKHGLTIKDTSVLKDQKIKNKKIKSNYSIYSYLITISIFIITCFAILNLSKDIIIVNYPVTESYVNYLYETLDVIKITISKLID
jgi:predicted Zn finger-like uncharacterized protein